ncbi:N-acetyl-gamma-glutamyl-phosphate reductase [Fusarium austroafricanum]|uniref:N-acetyl-gamma-glutamyl-phosphate reductase n=1 Tax=Fusarium austroafricanum TaxID=2364996 RepID=A0A8H4P9Z8_9HYPO|nr:N-acetyl-gamma-glutamyl-phosphate reductase [Fusarium austroafricanum]
MLSATSSALRTSARRVAPRAAALSTLAATPKISLNQRIVTQARCLSSTSRLSYAIQTNPNPPLGIKNASNDTPSRVALIGARGYTGQALIDLLDKHPLMDLRHVSSRELKGQELQGYSKRKIIYDSLSPEDVTQLDKDGQIDAWIFALPNSTCQPFVDALGDSKSLVVDLSADYRFDPDQKTWKYGLPELQPRSTLTMATRISNPGCYATGSQLALAPLVEHLGGVPSVFGVSGYSGAGTKPSPKNDLNNLKNNLLPCHIHEREIGHHLGAPVAFMPHVASWFSGIHLTINIPLNKEMTSRDIRQLYQDRYAGEKLVKIVGEAPVVKSIENKHHVEIGGFAVDSTGKRVVVCVGIDNLLKGAATQCLQNMNLALGYDEYQGIPL